MTLLFIATWRGGEVTPAVGYDALRVTLDAEPRLQVVLRGEPRIRVYLEAEQRLRLTLTAKP